MQPDCPDDLDDYAVGYLHEHLTAAEAAWYARHLPTCPRCRSALDEARMMIQALRDATSNPDVE